MITSNFHTHSVFCDGVDSPEDMVKEAVKKGFTHLGFSSHSFFPKDADWTLKPETEQRYKETIHALKWKYEKEIHLFCGIEQDYYSPPASGYEYIIGSVHYVFKDGEYLPVDLSCEALAKSIRTYYGGDFDAFAEAYFRTAADVVRKTNADIIGHFDLVQKYSEQNGFGQSNRFLDAAEKAVDALIPYGKPFEINTGAMAKKLRTVPYPSPEILKMIRAKGGKIVFSSDCHDKHCLDFGFETARRMAQDCGFTEHGILTEEGMQYISIP